MGKKACKCIYGNVEMKCTVLKLTEEWKNIQFSYYSVSVMSLTVIVRLKTKTKKEKCVKTGRRCNRPILEASSPCINTERNAIFQVCLNALMMWLQRAL